MRFYLGSHHPHWLSRAAVPLFVSRRTLARYKKLPRAVAPWALDSGGFSELSMFGAWQTSPRTYVDEVRRYRDGVGLLDWAAIQDWMCEPFITAKTGLTVAQHQERTIDSYATLRELAPEVPWRPVLQGWHPSDYLRHLDAYRARGFEDVAFGVGSVCRRQGTLSASRLVYSLKSQGLTLHLFGFKVQGLRMVRDYLDADDSADSLAWSYAARRRPPLDGHPHKNCANCLPFALAWRRDIVEPSSSPGGAQLDLPVARRAQRDEVAEMRHGATPLLMGAARADGRRSAPGNPSAPASTGEG